MNTLILMVIVATGLSAQAVTVITGSVRNAVTGALVANATVTIVSSGRFAVTRADGRYSLKADSGRVELRVTAIGFTPVSQIAAVSDGSTVINFALQPTAVPLEEVVSIGSRGPERTLTESPVPVDVISRQMLDNTGMPELWQQLQQLIPSLNVPHIPITDNHMRPVTLRGLAPHHVLVLVNGKRRHPASVLLSGPSVPSTAFTDLNAIPSSAIERVEVLRDGASAQYGSDAIGGVVNVILKSGYRRDLQTSVGEVVSSEGGRAFHDGRLFEGATTIGFASQNGGYLTVTGETRNRSGTNRAYPDKRQQYFTGDSRNEEAPRVSSYLGDGRVDAFSIFVDAATPVATHAEAYFFGGAADRNSLTPDAFFRRPLDARTVRAIHPNGFLPEIGSQINDVSAVTGVRGTFQDSHWDLSSGWGRNAVDYHVRNSNNVSLGAASPTEFYIGNVAADQFTGNADVSRQIKLRSFALSIAGGAEFRVERYQIRAGEPDSWRDGGVRILDGPAKGQPAQVGAQGMIGFRPTDEVSARRRSSAIYLEAEGRPGHRLLLQSAMRAERYSDFGSTLDGKVAVRMQVLRGLGLRGSLSTGFRAPALTQEYFSSTRTVFQLVNGVNTVLTVRTFPVNTPEARLMGATALRPETSVNRSAGLVFDVPRLPRLTADVYRIIIDDRIGLAASITDTSIIRLFEENGMRGIGGGSYFTNSRDTRTSGVEFVASHIFLIQGSALQILGGYNHARTITTRLAPLSPQLARFQSQIYNRATNGVIENGQPRDAISLTLAYTAGPFGMNLHEQRSGRTAQLDQAKPEADQILRPKWITDAGVSYQIRSRLKLSVTAANLFDVYPDEWRDFKDGLNAQGVSMQGIFRHPGGLSPFGMNGRTVYLRLAYH